MVGFQNAYQEAIEEIKGIASFFKKEAEGTDKKLSLFFRTEESWGIFQEWTYYGWPIYKQR